MIDLEALDWALRKIEEVEELVEGFMPSGVQVSLDVEKAHESIVDLIKEGLWERFLEARKSKHEWGAWKIVVRFEEARTQ